MGVVNNEIKIGKIYASVNELAKVELPKVYSSINALTEAVLKPVTGLVDIVGDESSGLVKSVNDLETFNTAIEITDYFGTMPENVSLKSGKIYKIGDFIVGNIVLRNTDNFSSTSIVIPIKNDYVPVADVNTGCFLGNEWSVFGVGYAFFAHSGKTLSILNSTGTAREYCKVHFVYKL